MTVIPFDKIPRRGNHRIRVFNGVEIPSATTTQIHHCGDPACDHLHLVGFDDEGKPLCEICVNESMILKMIQRTILRMPVS